VSASVGVACWVAASTVGSTFGVQSDSLTGTPAAFGLSYEANIFGGICAMWFLVDLLFVHRPLRAALLVRVPLLLGVATSLTRAAIVALVVGVVVNAVMSPSGRRVVRRLSVPAGLLVVGLLVAVPAVPAVAPIIDKASQVTDLESATTKVRFDSWEVAARDLRPGSIAVGLGVNSFGQRHEDPTRPHESVPGYIGNVFLQLVYDSGVVGLGLLAGSTLVMVLALRRRAPQVVAVLAAGAVIALATSPLWFGNWWVLFAAASTAAYAGPVRRRSQAANPLEVPAR
jgi:O-antigen ligase